MKKQSKLTSRISSVLIGILKTVFRATLRTLLWLAKNVWKRYFNIETPIYKLWWSAHAERMQKQLDKCHQINY